MASDKQVEELSASLETVSVSSTTGGSGQSPKLVGRCVNERPVSASTLGAYHHNWCQLYLHYMTKRRLSTEVEIHRTVARQSEFRKAVVGKGFVWEEHLKEVLEAKGLLFKVQNPKNSTQEVINKILSTTEDQPLHFYVVESEFISPEFLNKYKDTAKIVKFSIFKPDFIEFRTHFDKEKNTIVADYLVIDAKASSHAKISHQVQVTFYWLALQEIFSDNDKITYQPSDEGGIWLHHQEDPVYFSLSLVQPIMEDFFFGRLPELLDPESDPYWHYNTICSSCEFRESCKETTTKNKTLSYIPHLSFGDHKFLRSVLSSFAKNKEIPEIEQLNDLFSPTTIDHISTYPSTLSRVKKIINFDNNTNKSPVIDSILENKPKVQPRPCVILPKCEEIGVFISLLSDPGTEILHGYSILVSENDSTKAAAHNITVIEDNLLDEFVDELSKLIQELRETKKTVQFYLYNTMNHAFLMNLLVAKACIDSTDAVQQCIASLVDQTDVLMTSVQPELLDYALQAPTSKDNKQTLKEYLISVGANPEEVDKRLVAELRKWVKEIVSTSMTSFRSPRITILHSAIKQLVAIPQPGYFELSDCVNHLFSESKDQILSDEALYNTWRTSKDVKSIVPQLDHRNVFMHKIVKWIRETIQTNNGDQMARILPTEAVRLNPLLIKACKHPHLRRLLFMKQYEAVIKLEQLKTERFSKTGRAICLRFLKRISETQVKFTVNQGKEYLELDNPAPGDNFVMYKWLFVIDKVSELTADMTFNDLLYYNAYPKTLKIDEKEIGFAAIIKLSYPNEKKPYTRIVVDIKGFVRKFSFNQDTTCFLRERYVDFNIKKAITNLIELDKENNESQTTFIKVLENPNTLATFSQTSKETLSKTADKIAHFYREWYDLQAADKRNSVLKFYHSQRVAFNSILNNVFSIVWGPPGSGKTHTIALSVLRFLEVISTASKGEEKCHILMTAFTHIAIQQFLGKFQKLLAVLNDIPNVAAKPYLDTLQIVHLTSENNDKAIELTSKYAIVAGTVWGIHKWQSNSKYKQTIDVLVIDEGSQLPVADAAIAFRCLSKDARVVIAGDHYQLPPVISAKYPMFEPMLFSSILQCLIRTGDNRCVLSDFTPDMLGATTNILKENSRMVDTLAAFTQQIYKEHFKVLRQSRSLISQSKVARIQCPRIREVISSFVSNSPQQNMLTIKLTVNSNVSDMIPVEKHLSYEADVVARLIVGLKQCFTENEKVLVATPHRAQRALINSMLQTKHKIEDGGDVSNIKIDTVERMQGDEAPVVIGCYGFTNTLQLEGELDFIFNRNRLNVAISRAQHLCIMVVSDSVVNPPMVVLANNERRDAFAHIKSFVSSSFVYNWPVSTSFAPLALIDSPQ